MRKVYWHYTTLLQLESILKTGRIYLATNGVRPPERAVVWVSSNEIWEPTTAKGVGIGGPMLSMAEMSDQLGLARIEIDESVELFSWKGFKKRSGVRAWVAADLHDRGIAMGANPKDWAVSFSPISRNQFANVQLWTGSAWEDMADWQGFPMGDAPRTASLSDLKKSKSSIGRFASAA